MVKILFATKSETDLAALAASLDGHATVEVLRSQTRPNTLERLAADPIDLVILDEQIGDTNGLELAGELVTKNPLVNIALVSDLDADAFHEATEGLGILMQLPRDPGRREGLALWERLNTILAMTSAAGA